MADCEHNGLFQAISVKIDGLAERQSDLSRRMDDADKKISQVRLVVVLILGVLLGTGTIQVGDLLRTASVVATTDAVSPAHSATIGGDYDEAE